MKLFKTILALGIFTLIWAGDLPDKRHIGLWQNIEDEDTNYFHFRADRYIDIIADNDTLSGDSFVIGGDEVMCIKHRTNYSVQPHTIDFVIYFKESMLQSDKVKGLFKLDSLGQMHLTLDTDDSGRPLNFEEEETHILTRIK